MLWSVSRASHCRITCCHFGSQGLVEPRQCTSSPLVTRPSASSVPSYSEKASKWLAGVNVMCCKAVCGTWILMLAPLFVSMLYLGMITCVTDLGATWPHWCSFVRVIDCRATAEPPAPIPKFCRAYTNLLLFSLPSLLLFFIFNKLPITGVLQGYQQFTEIGVGKMPLLFNLYFLSSEIIDIKKTLVLMHFYLTKQHCTVYPFWKQYAGICSKGHFA